MTIPYQYCCQVSINLSKETKLLQSSFLFLYNVMDIPKNMYEKSISIV